jgi:hypothetical protein
MVSGIIWHEIIDALPESLFLYRGNVRLDARFLESSSDFETLFPELSYSFPTQDKPKPQFRRLFNATEPGA